MSSKHEQWCKNRDCCIRNSDSCPACRSGYDAGYSRAVEEVREWVKKDETHVNCSEGYYTGYVDKKDLLSKLSDMQEGK